MWKTIAIFTVILAAAGLALAQESPMTPGEHTRTLKEVMAEIRQSQNLGPDQEIDCDKVTDAQYEELGEAWMDVMVPNERQHEMMDRMMGGEGSESLAIAHRRMGARYLGCLAGSYGGMMGPGMMGGYGGGMMYGGHLYGGGTGDPPGPGYGGHMMYGYDGGGWMHSWGGSLVGWLILLAIAGLIIFLIVSSRRDHHTAPVHHESPLDTLKKRYARGEISEEEYERMRQKLS
jgi:uncharacterized membrane protein